MKKIEFTKMHGIGNDYIYIDCFKQDIDDPSCLARIMSPRRTSVGSDGVILICPSDVADAKMRMFNLDGSEGKMCGNGIRCVGKYIYDTGIAHKDTLTVETLSGIKTLEVTAENGKAVSLTVDMGEPILTPKDIPVIFDGDRMIAVFALDMKKKGILNDNTAVVTVMTNLGFKQFAERSGINVLETKVGDRYVLEEMLKNDYQIGGEQSGHIIFKRFATTGDGQLSGAMLAAILAKTGRPASEIASVMTVLPQTLVNIKASPELKEKLNTDSEIKAAIEKVKKELGKRGRILVRASGTEPLIRVMLEGENIAEIKRLAREVAAVIEGKA